MPREAWRVRVPAGMCFDTDARPPLPPIRGGAVDARDVTLASADGTDVGAYAARAAEPRGPGIVIIPDVRGLNAYYQELARTFAEAGVHAIAVDLYARTAGIGPRGDDFDHEPHVKKLDATALAADVVAAASYLRSEEGGAAERLYSVGFCIGGRVSLLQAAAGIGLDGVIGFYPWPVGPHRSGLPAPADEAPRFGCRVLTLYGGADAGIPAEAREHFDRALVEAGVDHATVVYDGAPHSFFDRKSAEFADASTDAWRRMLEFVAA